MKILDFEYIDNKDNIVTVEEIEVDYWFNMNKYQQALMLYMEDKDTVNFASKLLPEMILTPTNLKDVKTLNNDFQSLSELVALLIEVQTKKLKAQQKKKSPRLSME